MRINGWQRLWLVACLLLAVPIAFDTYAAVVSGPSAWEMDAVRTGVLVWLAASIFLLIVGHAVAWAVRGFRR